MIYLKAETMLLIVRILVFFIAAPLFILVDVAAFCLDTINIKYKCKKLNSTFLLLLALIISIEIFETFISTESELFLVTLKYFIKSILLLGFIVKSDALINFLMSCFIEMYTKRIDFRKAIKVFKALKIKVNPSINIKTGQLYRICFIKSIQQKNHDSRNRDFYFS